MGASLGCVIVRFFWSALACTNPLPLLQSTRSARTSFRAHATTPSRLSRSSAAGGTAVAVVAVGAEVAAGVVAVVVVAGAATTSASAAIE